MSESQLSSLLSGMKIGNSVEVAGIVDLAKKGGHYGLACQKHFDLTHPDHAHMKISGSVSRFFLGFSKFIDCLVQENVAEHPNKWYQISTQYYAAKATGGIPIPSDVPPENSLEEPSMELDNSLTA